MDIKLREEDRIRINDEYCGYSQFIDIRRLPYLGLETTLFTGFQYIEVRRKGDLVKVFTWPKKSFKKEHDFGDWADSEVLLAINEQVMNK